MTWLADIIICTPDRFLLLYKETLLLFCIFLPHYTPCGTQLMPFVDLLTTKLGDFDSFIYKLKQYRHLKNSKRSPFSNSCRHIPACVPYLKGAILTGAIKSVLDLYSQTLSNPGSQSYKEN